MFPVPSSLAPTALLGERREQPRAGLDEPVDRRHRVVEHAALGLGEIEEETRQASETIEHDLFKWSRITEVNAVLVDGGSGGTGGT